MIALAVRALELYLTYDCIQDTAAHILQSSAAGAVGQAFVLKGGDPPVEEIPADQDQKIAGNVIA